MHECCNDLRILLRDFTLSAMLGTATNHAHGRSGKTNGSVRAPCSIATDACWHKAGGSFGLAPRFAKGLAGVFPFQLHGREKG